MFKIFTCFNPYKIFKSRNKRKKDFPSYIKKVDNSMTKYQLKGPNEKL